MTNTERAWMRIHHRAFTRLDWYLVGEGVIVVGACVLLVLFIVGVRP